MNISRKIYLCLPTFWIGLACVQASALSLDTMVVQTDQQNVYRGVTTQLYTDYDKTWEVIADRYYAVETITYQDGRKETTASNGQYWILSTATWNTFFTSAGSGDNYTWTSGWASSQLYFDNPGPNPATVSLSLTWARLTSTAMADRNGTYWYETKNITVNPPGTTITPPFNGVQIANWTW